MSTKFRNVYLPIILLVSVITTPIACIYGFKQLLDVHARNIEMESRQRMQNQIADVKSGESSVIIVMEGSASRDELIQAKDTFESSDRFELAIEYTQDVDKFLGQIAGLRGVRRLYFHQTDVTDAGLVHVATFPDLEKLMLERGKITDVGIEALQACPKLEKLVIEPYRANVISIAKIVKLPHLLRLVLHDPEGGGWINQALSELETNTLLEELTLSTNDISAEDLQRLQNALPNCKITLQKQGQHGK